MARGKKRGPKTPWQNRVHYNRAKCEARLKPSQIENLTAADAFAVQMGKPLHGYLTIKFSENGHPLHEFRAGTKRLSQWHRRWGGELRWIYVWEALGGFHVHALVHVPCRIWRELERATAKAFAGLDVLLKRRSAGPAAMAYLCKGTDLQTHWKLRRHSNIYAKAQGRIAWKRCGCSQNIGPRARKRAGNEMKNRSSNCAKTYTRPLGINGRPRQGMNAGNRHADKTPSFVVPKSSHAPLEAASGTAHITQAPIDAGRNCSVHLGPVRKHGL
jgi:hypothetical protein